VVSLGPEGHAPCETHVSMRRACLSTGSLISRGSVEPDDVQPLISPGQLRVVALGGGTGLPIVLEGLKHALFAEPGLARTDSERDRLAAIVTVADDGGSSGRLREAYGVLPPGDIRNCLLALADCDSILSAMFDYRFDGGSDVSGHSLGNLILTALSRLEQDFAKAVEHGSQLLGVRGRVFPSTTEHVRLRAELADGSWVEGESRIASGPRTTIRRVSLEPGQPQPVPRALEAALQADLVVLGPGSLYPSLIPVLLVGELGDAIRRSGARVVLVMNLTTEPGETDGYTAADHLLAIRRHAPDVPIHDVLLNTGAIDGDLASRAVPVAPDVELLRALGYRPVVCDLLGAGPKIRHDSCKLGSALMQLARRARTRTGLRTAAPVGQTTITAP
jgi:uncharacterized cofD-like protein